MRSIIRRAIIRATAGAANDVPDHGVGLVRTAIGRVIEDGSARNLLRWTERWRSTLHATTTRKARQDPALTAELGKLRETESDIGGVVDADREANRRRIEERIPRLTHGSAGDGEGARRAFDVGELLDELGGDATRSNTHGSHCAGPPSPRPPQPTRCWPGWSRRWPASNRRFSVQLCARWVTGLSS